MCICPCIFLQHIQLIRKNIQGGISCIFDFNIILHHLIYLDLLNSFVDSKAVIFVDHIISDI
ncbi:hypothetical protein EVA_17796 [gut metagenome]|uniref:Uncharacterized protein n=1 Tax=gut metagenome TaxID=749906 RepID=J9FI55_9ZZZZ